MVCRLCHVTESRVDHDYGTASKSDAYNRKTIWKLMPRERKELPDDAHQARFSVAFILAPAWAFIW